LEGAYVLTYGIAVGLRHIRISTAFKKIGYSTKSMNIFERRELQHTGIAIWDPGGVILPKEKHLIP
jgi:hypothetical protein